MKRKTKCDEKRIEELVEKLHGFLRNENTSQFNYERYLLLDKALYLEKFIEGKPFPPFEVEIQMSSKCNLHCVWCIGGEIQEKKRVLQLQNNINEKNIDQIVDGILTFRVNGLRIEKVKFSGFIGEPLLKKKATLKGIMSLAGAGLKVGLFTNGVFMDDNLTREVLANIEYVHVSLDAGPITYCLLKNPNNPYEPIFDRVIKNIKNLADHRKKVGGKVEITCGFVIVPGNFIEIYETTRLVRDAGANAIRFKVDIGGKHDLKKAGLIDKVFEQLKRVEQDFNNPPSFAVHIIHSEDDIRNKSYAEWRCENGCHFHNFLSTVGSDGLVYLCDHNTMPGAIPLGSALDNSFEDIWVNERRKYLTDGIRYTCQCGVCPPFGNRANFLLEELVNLKDKYGADCLKRALQRFKSNI